MTNDCDKRQTHPFVREGVPQRKDRDCQTVINIWSWVSDRARHQDWLTDWLTDRQSQCDFEFDLTWNLHKEMIEDKAFRTYIRIYPLFKSERLSPNIKLILHKAPMRSVMTYACPARELAENTYLLNCSSCKPKFSARLKFFQGAYWSAICTWSSSFRIYTII
jgi:hypothetical protein